MASSSVDVASTTAEDHSLNTQPLSPLNRYTQEQQNQPQLQKKPQHSHEWRDVTQAFAEARRSMALGEMITSSRFTLFSAMSAIELMDPKMDVGCGPVRDLRDIPLPTFLSDLSTLNILDRLFACEMSWLDSHTLPQTVFSCVYVHRLDAIPRHDLYNFIRLQLATMHVALNVILDEKVADDEDFVTTTFGLHLPPLIDSRHSQRDDQRLRRMFDETIAALNDAPSSSTSRGHDVVAQSDDEQQLRDAIVLRIQFRTSFYKVLNYLGGHYNNCTPVDADVHMQDLSKIVQRWMHCPYRHRIDEEFLSGVFDASINRHLMTSTPPSTAPLFNIDEALQYLQRLTIEWTSMLALRRFALPPYQSAPSPATNSMTSVEPNSPQTMPSYSLHVAVHAVELYCMQHNPCVLSRSLMSRVMLRGPDSTACMFEDEAADFVRMILTDIGHLAGQTSEVDIRRALTQAEVMREGVVSIFESFCHNRSRQRRQLLRVLRWWDHCSIVANRNDSGNAHENGVDGESGGGDPRIVEVGKQGGESQESDDDEAGACRGPKQDASGSDGIDARTPLQIVTYEVSCRLMIQHWLLGFECDLYHEFEYAAIFFYIGYVLTSLSNATTSLAQSNVKGAMLHPMRFALYLVDEARLCLCRALYLACEAFSEGAMWAYSCQRASLQKHKDREMFGSEELWYEQRFGVAVGLLHAPPHPTHEAFRALMMKQEDRLRCSSDDDIIELRLREALKAFVIARQWLKKAKKEAEVNVENMLLDDALKLGRVAVENSLSISTALRQYISRRDSTEPMDEDKHSVTFLFSTHRHFPVIKVNETKT